MTTTSLTPYLGEGLLNVGDFFQFQSILHPITVGSIAIIFLFGWLRLSSNRTVAPLTIWDEIVSVALGSTLAGIINGQTLVRGLQAVAVLLIWQYLTSWIGCKVPKLGVIFTKPPLVLAFRGRLLEGLMKKHRINEADINGAMRVAGIFNICEVECIVVEPTGVFSVFKIKDVPQDYEPEVLLSIKGYRELAKQDDEEKRKQKNQGMKEGKNGEERSEGSGHQGEEGNKDEKEKEMNEKNKDEGEGHGSYAEDRDEEGQTKEDKIADDAAT